MKKLKRWFKDMFDPDTFNNLDTAAMGEAFNDLGVRTLWLNGCFDEIKRINLELDKRLLNRQEWSLTGLAELCARRKAYQDVLESILSARRTVVQDTRHNPRPEVAVNLDRVTA